MIQEPLISVDHLPGSHVYLETKYLSPTPPSKEEWSQRQLPRPTQTRSSHLRESGADGVRAKEWCMFLPTLERVDRDVSPGAMRSRFDESQSAPQITSAIVLSYALHR